MALTAAGTRVVSRPITAVDVPAVSAFLHEHLNSRVPAEAWARATQMSWGIEAPNAGVMLLEGDDVVGVHLAYYSARDIRGRTERFCDLGAFCVLPQHRFHALRLLKALLAQDDYTFRDLSPSGNVVALNQRLGFEFLDTTTTLTPNLPWPSRPGRATVTADPAVIERALRGAELRHYLDHDAAPAARHVLLLRGDERCHVMFRKDRRKGIPLFASILHVSNASLYREMARPLARHLLLRHGAIATLAERTVVDFRPRLSHTIADSARKKMFRSRTLGPQDIDYLYSELVRLPW